MTSEKYRCGLSHPIEELNSIDLSEMSSWSLERQAQYADNVIIEAVKNKDVEFLGSQSIEKPIALDMIKYLNATALGNIAHIALYAQSPFKEQAQIPLAQIKNHFESITNPLSKLAR
jgi:hypothetical protein